MFWRSHFPEQVSTEFGVEHLCMFGALGFFVELSRRKWHSLTWLHLLIAYGLVTEILQHFTPSRTCDLLDFCQNCAGAYLGILCGLIAKRVYGMRPLLQKPTIAPDLREVNQQEHGERDDKH